MSDFGETMRADCVAFEQAKAVQVATPRKTGKAATKYECECSGIDMIVSRIVNGKCTMKLCIYLSRLNDNDEGTMFIKTMKDGSMKEATIDNVNTFLSGLSRDMVTESTAIPVLKSGKKFATTLISLRRSEYINLIKEGLLNIELLEEGHYAPWYVGNNMYRNTSGYGIADKHAKLVRHMVSALAERDNQKYPYVLTRTCGAGYGYAGYHDCRYEFIWAFSMLADVYDEPFAQKCFDEYIDNYRLGGLESGPLYRFFSNLTKGNDGGYYGYNRDWADVVKKLKIGQCLTTLDKNRFWDYLQQSVGVGLGKRLEQYLSLYSDYLRQALECDGKIRDKYPADLQVIHDIYSEKYTLIKEYRDTEKLEAATTKGAAIIDQVHKDHQLKVLREVNDFLEEARQNCNCVASYVDKVREGRCWVASFRPVDSPTTVLTIEIDPLGSMVQIKGKYNRNPTEKELELLKPFVKGIDKKMHPELYIDAPEEIEEEVA